MGPSVTVSEASRRARCRILIEGVVQGVGFRPFVYRLAEAHRLIGSVRNGRHGVQVEAEGDQEALSQFLDDLQSVAPSAARPRRFSITWVPPHGEAGTFSIDTSSGEGEPALFPAPDLAVCRACLAEMNDPADRRHEIGRAACRERGKDEEEGLA